MAVELQGDPIDAPAHPHLRRCSRPRAHCLRCLSGSAFAQSPVIGCQDAAELAILPVPVAPWKGAAARHFAADKPIEGELSLIAPDGSVANKSRERRGGRPISGSPRSPHPLRERGARLVRDNAPAECTSFTREIAVRGDEPPKPTQTAGSVWPLRGNWNRATENLYSAWIEKLFDSPLDDLPSWKALHEVLRDKSRNMLFNYLGLGEDEMKQVFKPDCADMPYFLRAISPSRWACRSVIEMHARPRLARRNVRNGSTSEPRTAAPAAPENRKRAARRRSQVR